MAPPNRTHPPWSRRGRPAAGPRRSSAGAGGALPLVSRCGSGLAARQPVRVLSSEIRKFRRVQAPVEGGTSCFRKFRPVQTHANGVRHAPPALRGALRLRGNVPRPRVRLHRVGPSPAAEVAREASGPRESVAARSWENRKFDALGTSLAQRTCEWRKKRPSQRARDDQRRGPAPGSPHLPDRQWPASLDLHPRPPSRSIKRPPYGIFPRA
jgi:hypothetical protein